MAYVQIRATGEFGLITDRPGHEMPQNAFTTLENVMVRDGYIMRAYGQTDVFGAPSVNPYYVFPAPSVDSLYWVYTNLAKFYAVSSSGHVNITRQNGGGDEDYTGDIDDKWNSAWLAGILILNNGVDLPQLWKPVITTQELVNLPNWESDYRAAVIRPFKNFLIRMDITKDTTRYPTLVGWSHPTDLGAEPSSWDVTDNLKLAGERPLSDTPGFVIDGLAMRQSFLVYKEDSVIAMSSTQNNDVFRFDNVTNRYGTLAVNCVKEIAPGVHVSLTNEGDVVTVTQGDVKSVISGRNKRQLQASLETEYRKRAFLMTDMQKRELSVYIPANAAEYCNEAYVWNWEEDTWCKRTSEDIVSAQEGPLDVAESASTWDSITESWDAVDFTWNQQLFSSNRAFPVGAFLTTDALRRMGSGQKYGTSAYTSVIERRGLGVVGSEPDGSPRVNYQRKKVITGLWPIFDSDVDIDVTVYVGGQETARGAINWQGPFTFNTGQAIPFVNCLIETYFLAVRFEVSAETAWKFHGFGLNIVVSGSYL